MAEALLSLVVEQLGSIIVRELEQEVRLVVGVEKEVDKLKSNLTAIQAVLADAETRQVKEATVRDWLEKLKDVAYDIGDVLDDWEAAILSSQRKPGDEQVDPKPERKVCSFLRSSCFCCKQVGLHLRHDIANKMKELNERLDRIARERECYHFDAKEGNPTIERLTFTSEIDITEVKGREEDKSVLLSRLLSEPSDRDGSDLPVLSIVGMGGIGKTTLAKFVFNHNSVKAYFDEKIWICVSEPFDEIRVAEAILESLLDRTPDVKQLQSLLDKIGESIKGKKFFLVLDDVWEENSRKWDRLKEYLSYGSPGSKVLVTTRKEIVASVMGCIKKNILKLGILSDEECWLIISKRAFLGRNSSECKYLEEIGREISKKCKGLPLAAKALGGILQFRKTREEWRSILVSKVWESEEAQRDVFAPLWLSYYDLSPVLKRCFGYCAIFPKDYEIEKQRLIEMWMAQGYLMGTQNDDLEIFGEYCFQNLAMRSFFQDYKKEDAWSEEEDEKLRAYILRYGHWNWRQLPKYAGLSRCGKSCRLRWVNHLRPHVTRRNFTKEEDDLIMKLYEQLGNRWSVIASKMPGRTDNEVKNRWHTHLKKLRAKELEYQSAAAKSKEQSGRFNDQSIHLKKPHVQQLENQSAAAKSKVQPGMFCDQSIISFKMHDIVHDFAQIVAWNECRSVQVDESEELIRKVRHLCLDRGSYLSSSHGFEKKRSLLLWLQPTTGELSRLFRESTHVRSLSLRDGNFEEIPSSISKLVHLRWLDLSRNDKLKQLPEMLCELHNLETIDVSGCSDDLQLPLGIGKLINLRHFHNIEGPSRLPKGIARLTGLRTLEVVDVSCGGDKFSLGNLKNLNQLRGSLTIRNLGAHNRHVDEAKEAELKKKEHLTRLELNFKSREGEEGEEGEEEEGEEEEEEEHLLEALEPSLNLEVLSIFNYRGTNFPDWVISLTNLRSIALSDCEWCEHLPSLGKLPSLETLLLFGMKGVKKMGDELLGIETQIGDRKSKISAAASSSSSSSSSPVVVVAFPKLTKLQFHLMYSWEEWDDYFDGITKPPAIIMPSLRSLEIDECRSLKALPDYILQNTMLHTLVIKRSHLLEERYNKEEGEDCNDGKHHQRKTMIILSRGASAMMRISRSRRSKPSSSTRLKPGSKTKVLLLMSLSYDEDLLLCRCIDFASQHFEKVASHFLFHAVQLYIEGFSANELGKEGRDHFNLMQKKGFKGTDCNCCFCRLYILGV